MFYSEIAMNESVNAQSQEQILPIAQPFGSTAGIRGGASRPNPVQLIAGSVAHDLNSALCVVLGHTDLALQDAIPGSDQADSLLAIGEAARRMATHVRQLLAYSGLGSSYVEPVNLAEVATQGCRQVIENCNGRPSLRLTRRGPRSLEPWIRADRVQMREMLNELLANACVACSPGAFVGVEVEVCAPSHAGAAIHTGIHAGQRSDADIGDWGGVGRVVLRVIDSGGGMDESVLAQAKDPYFSTSPHRRGLGLAAVEGIARAHGGKFTLSSALGIGTVASVVFPIEAGGTQQQQQLSLPSAAPRGERSRITIGDRLGQVAPSEALANVFGLGDELKHICLDVPEAEASGWARILGAWRPDVVISGAVPN